MSDPIAWLHTAGTGRGDDLAVAFRPGIGLGLATATGRLGVPASDPVAVVARIEREVGPRWIWWDRTTSDPIAVAGVAVARSWDVLTVHRLLHGGWRTSVAAAWAWLHGLAQDSLPTMGQLDLLGFGCARAEAAGIDADRIVNTWPQERLLDWAAAGGVGGPG